MSVKRINLLDAPLSNEDRLLVEEVHNYVLNKVEDFFNSEQLDRAQELSVKRSKYAYVRSKVVHTFDCLEITDRGRLLCFTPEGVLKITACNHVKYHFDFILRFAQENKTYSLALVTIRQGDSYKHSLWDMTDYAIGHNYPLTKENFLKIYHELEAFTRKWGKTEFVGDKVVHSVDPRGAEDLFARQAARKYRQDYKIIVSADINQEVFWHATIKDETQPFIREDYETIASMLENAASQIRKGIEK